MFDVIDPTKRIHSDKKYGAVGFSLFFIMIVTCWLITWLFQRDTIEANPMKKRIGYNNLVNCFDEQPANSLGAVAEAVVIYFGIRAEWTLIEIASLMHQKNELGIWALRMSCAMSCLQILSWAITSVIFAIHPLEFNGAVWVHSGAFLQFVLIFSMRQWNYYLTFCTRTPMATALLVVNAFCAASFAVSVIVDFLAFDRKESIPVHPWFVMVVDYTWFVTGLMVPAITKGIYHEVVMRSLNKPELLSDCSDSDAQTALSVSTA